MLPGAATGIDMTAALAMADALGVVKWFACEVLSDVECALVSHVNEQIADARGQDGQRSTVYGDWDPQEA